MLQVSREATERAEEQRESLRKQAEEALGAAEVQKQDAWQALDRMNADLDRALDRATRAEYRLHSVQSKTGPSQIDKELQANPGISSVIFLLKHVGGRRGGRL